MVKMLYPQKKFRSNSQNSVKALLSANDALYSRFYFNFKAACSYVVRKISQFVNTPAQNRFAAPKNLKSLIIVELYLVTS
jgi:hypothetical protein